MGNDDELLDWAAEATKEKRCAAPLCTARPVCTRNGRHLCAKHRDAHDNPVFGCPCENCGSRNYTATPDAESVAVCAVCDRVYYDEEQVNSEVSE